MVLLFLAVLMLVFQFFVTLFIHSHVSEYSIKTSDNDYEVVEKFKQKKDESVYHFSVVDHNQNEYTFSMEHDFNKQSRVLKNIYYFSKNGLNCIFPIYKREVSGDISCLYKGEQVSYSYLKQISNHDILEMVQDITKKGYRSPSWKVSDYGKKFETILLYEDNLVDDYIFTMWFYKGIYIIKDGKVLRKDILEKDSYENVYSFLIDKYYVTANTDSFPSDISEFYVYNIHDLGKSTVELGYTVSKDIYYNGVYDKWLYFTDPSFKKQYRLQPSSLKVEEVGNEELGYQVVEGGEMKRVSAKDFFGNKVYFNTFIQDEDLRKKYGALEILQDDDFYYYKTEDGRIYQLDKEKKRKPLLLFQFSDIKQWKVKNGSILVVVGDTVYFYQERFGLRPIAVNSELLYNYKNICDFMEK